MHDGLIAYQHASNCVKKLVELNKKLIIISNSSKRNKATSDQLVKLGFEKSHFFEIMTSGEMIWQNLYTKSHKFIQTLGTNCYHLFDETKEEGIKYIEGLGYNFVNNIENADFILGCTPSSGFTTLDYVPLLEQAIKKDIPFVCANPDFVTKETSSNNLFICMGTIA
jgi:ribonucleotide monophosphatase NagD (HAD superfamily)